MQNIPEELISFDKTLTLDSLTGLPDRKSFFELGNRVFAYLKNSGFKVAILAIDFASIRHVAQHLGYIERDEILKQVGDRIRAQVPDNGRIGKTDPEFAILLWNIKSSEEVRTLADKIIQSVSEPFIINQHRFYLYCNIGICIHPDKETYTKSFNDFIRQVELAIPRESEGFRNHCRVFTASLSKKIERFEKIDSEIHHAISNHELSIYYQPRVNLSNGEIMGAEALLRWDSPVLGKVEPEECIPILERTGYIVEITEWVLKKACEEALQWQSISEKEIELSVNFSPQVFVLPDLVERVTKIIEEIGFPFELLEIEITESLLLQNTEQVFAFLERFREKNIKVSLDDFGTGYSSLRYLADLPLSAIKIDRSFVAGLPQSNISNGIARTIAILAKSLNIKSIAEGMENHDQVISLKVLNYEIAQGFYFSKPLPLDKFNSILAANKILPFHKKERRSN